MIVSVRVPVWDVNCAGSLIPQQDVELPGPVLGLDPLLFGGLPPRISLWCHKSISSHTVGVYLVKPSTELPLHLDLALTYGQARWLGAVEGIHVLLGPRDGQPVAL